MHNHFRDRIAFYNENYEIISDYNLISGNKTFLGNKTNKLCRFCGNDHNQTSFRQEKHVIPESIGNKLLFSFFECDECNQKFGKSIEDHFSKWSLPSRVLNQIPGKKGKPTYKTVDELLRYESKNNTIKFVSDIFDGETICNDYLTFDTKNSLLKINLPLQPYIPLNIYKCLVKIGISLLEDKEIQYFGEAIDWIQDTSNSYSLINPAMLLSTFVPGPLPFYLKAFLLKRKNDSIKMPYMFFLLAYGSNLFQIILPCPQKDSAKEINLHYFPTPYDNDKEYLNKYGKIRRTPIDLTSNEVKKDDVHKVSIHFDTFLKQNSE